MQFDSFQSFLAMGGYGLYVWLSFGVGLLSLLLLWWHGLHSRRCLIEALRKEQARQTRIRASQQNGEKHESKA
ncbi:heme exporter protein CcmD [Aliiglaciecola sp. CAU 1673]|uniref:heme exporter protein CcmD n=1 Tax=Aliiglaciecola sp. CAU 1673 TaxID=3032595 RepID=UPI0023DA2696|nr:heme exporter protein CcmD [Aliiglaciecola sp. CAU 1673]MDF2177488.1 heme exporter protein CcmD [Aliiglaciecola sp. CAU 1673]